MTILIHPAFIERRGLPAVIDFARSVGGIPATGHGRSYLKLWQPPQPAASKPSRSEPEAA